MVKHIAILSILITIGTNVQSQELGQECKYIQTVETDKYGNTSSSQRYECKTAPREIVTKTKVVRVQSCLKKVLFGIDCDEYEPEGDEINKVLTTMFSMGVLN